MEFFNYKNKKIHFIDKGQGNVMVFLHGFLESVEIFNQMINDLSKKHRVIAFDLPGHGHTDVFSSVHDMNFMAEIVNELLNHLNISDVFILGHSMGGYATLAFAELFQEKCRAIGLMHSHPFNDNDEKKADRQKQILLIQDGKKDLIIRTMIPNLYATRNLEKMSSYVNFSTEIALKTPKEGFSAALEGMKRRPDRQSIIENKNLPVLWIYGKLDNLIPYKKINSLVDDKPHIKSVLLHESGHMGFFEEPKKTIDEISDFMNHIYQ